MHLAWLLPARRFMSKAKGGQRRVQKLCWGMCACHGENKKEMEEKSGKFRKKGEEAATKCGAKAEAQGEPQRGRGSTFAQQTALAAALGLGITFYRQPRAPRAGKVNVKIKTSEGCSFSGSDMQSNPMPQSLRRKDKRQPLPGLAGQGADGGLGGHGGSSVSRGSGRGGTKLLGWRGRAVGWGAVGPPVIGGVQPSAERCCGSARWFCALPRCRL